MAWLDRFGWLIGPKNTTAKIVIIGLVNSGKSTLMQQVKPPQVRMQELPPNVPIVGLHAEGFNFKSLNFVAFDLGDLEGFGNPWEDHYRDCHGVIFVTDSTDTLNVPRVKDQLERVLANKILNKRGPIPVLVLANKADKSNAVSSLQMAQLLDVGQVSSRPVEVFSSDGLTGEGLNEAMDWLAFKLKPICAKT